MKLNTLSRSKLTIKNKNKCQIFISNTLSNNSKYEQKCEHIRVVSISVPFLNLLHSQFYFVMVDFCVTNAAKGLTECRIRYDWSARFLILFCFAMINVKYMVRCQKGSMTVWVPLSSRKKRMKYSGFKGEVCKWNRNNWCIDSCARFRSLTTFLNSLAMPNHASYCIWRESKKII